MGITAAIDSALREATAIESGLPCRFQLAHAGGQPAANPAAEQPSNVPSGSEMAGSSRSPGWTTLFDFEGEEGAQPDPQNAPENPVAPGEADILPPVPYPYHEDEVIGGDSVLSIRERLLGSHSNRSAEEIYLAHLDAEDRFEVKVDIIRHMAVLDPSGDWEGRGARALDNPRTSTGEDSLKNLSRLRDQLHDGGVQSDAFKK
ncbi:uncharacterized protein LOC116190076 [Punica granatum]|uniref:Uncharacterized protein LOC116190028 n=1 Tax=Punica granatum TaxID=22663 RepID=A0A6P8C2G5_PUNGR|nr:uncharacterized protein LOC116190028 [Punica granatum]XP_031375571.1 uncharacterized protein LOC116190031 [Punica granatum]XP_031375573.1 uncharacterized protein LOC116190034 [Punica granatum]XP_031375595.1 uncharacterized protein LOC116190063 [Punica granatum]XP_031375599.1 uncharacterized protein LOC116190076 [Punica granatum]